MKRFRSLLAGALIICAGLAATVYGLQEQVFSSKAVKNCADIPAAKFATQRSLSVIVREKQALAIILKDDGEQNYSPPGGHIEPGETPQGALIRELREEASIEVEPKDLSLYKVSCARLPGGLQRTYFYNVAAWSGELQPKGSNNSIKWVDFAYAANSKADSELAQLLLFLHKDGLIN